MTGRKKSYGFDLKKEETLDWSHTQRRKPAEGVDRGSGDRKKTQGKEKIGYTLNEFLVESSFWN